MWEPNLYINSMNLFRWWPCYGWADWCPSSHCGGHKCNCRPAHENFVMGTVACFPPTTSASPCQYHSANATFSHCFYNTALMIRTSGRILGTFKNSSTTLHIGEYWTEIHCRKILVNFIIQRGFNLSIRFRQCSIHIFTLEYHFNGNDKRAKPVIFNKENPSRIPNSTGQKSRLLSRCCSLQSVNWTSHYFTNINY
jgi:hypothetical protein